MSMQPTNTSQSASPRHQQSDLFGEDIPRVLEEARQRHAMAMHVRSQRLLERRRNLVEDDTLWKDHPLAARIRAMIEKLQSAGPQAEDMLACIMSGIQSNAGHGRIDLKTIEFLEDKVRQELARIGQSDSRPTATWNERTGHSLAEEDAAVAALPLGIRQAAAVRINELGQRLAALGYRDHHEVNAASPDDARRLKRDIADIYNAMMSLAPARYRAEKGYRNFKRENLERDESELSALLGIETRELPGVCMDQPLTSGGLRQERARRSKQPKDRSSPAAPKARAAHQHDLLAP